jgi:hypothetical protein
MLKLRAIAREESNPNKRANEDSTYLLVPASIQTTNQTKKKGYIIQ